MDKKNELLQPGVYLLPNNCKAFVRAGKVYVDEKWKAIDETPRCRNCRHFGKGFNSYNQAYESPVCLARPKTNGLMNGYQAEVLAQQRYYATRQERRACDKYEPKDDKK